MLRRIFLPLLVLAALIFVGSRIYAPNSYRCERCNVILISIDSLRPDRLGCYGNPRPTSPNVDSFAQDSVRFSSAVSQGPSTAVSHASMLTSLPPSMHGAFVTRMTPISPSVPTLAELLKARGFLTASFNGGGQVGKEFGFARGFDTYQSYSGSDYTTEFFGDRVQELISWLEQSSKGQFFIFLHSYEVHTPYAPQDEFSRIFNAEYQGRLPKNITWGVLDQINSKKIPFGAADKEFVIGQYDAEIRSMDQSLQRLLEYLRKHDLYDDTLIIFTSDHGEEFGEHGGMGLHSHTLYDELLKVPLIVKFPAQHYAGRVIDTQVRGLDLVPTIFDVLGIKTPSHFEGASLIDAIEGRSFPEIAISQRDSKHKRLPTSARTKEWKATRSKLFNLIEDPRELIDLTGKHPEIESQLGPIVESYSVATPSGSAATPAAIEPDAGAVEQLKTLGYLN